MAESASSRFTPQNKTTNERLSTHTVGLVALSDFRKRRAEVLEQQEREAREAVFAGGGTTSTPDRSQTGTPDKAGSESANDAGADAGTGTGAVTVKKRQKKDKKKSGRKLLSFGDDDDDDGNQNDKETAEEDEGGEKVVKEGEEKKKKKEKKNQGSDDSEGLSSSNGEKKSKLVANSSIGIIPRVVTTSALRKEAAEREALRREFVALQEAVKATEIALPFVFYDGTNIPGGMVRVKKGDFVWVFLDKCRRQGAELGVGEHRNVLRAWARARVDDLMLVRGTVIIPHHYDFYYFIMNKNVGPGGKRLFDYSAEAPLKPTPARPSATPTTSAVMVTAESKAAAVKALPNIRTLEGASDDPTVTKVVDRRWYERNRHIYPASTWQKFDPEKDYSNEIRKDTGGNTFFYSK